MITAIASTIASTTALAIAVPAATQTVPIVSALTCPAEKGVDCLQGSWTGPLLGADWTFEFTRADGAWSGRYITTQSKRWQPLTSLEVAGRTVEFRFESRPPMIFALTLDDRGTTLTGKVEIVGIATRPFAAPRQP